MTRNGFTLIELIITVAIVAILASIAVPSFSHTSADNRMTTIANTLASALMLARVEAVRRGSAVEIAPQVSDSNDWGTNGYHVYRVNEDDSIEPLRIFEPIGNGLSLKSDRTSGLTFRPTGMTDLAYNLQLCSDTPGVADRQIDVAYSGRVSITKTDCT